MKQWQYEALAWLMIIIGMIIFASAVKDMITTLRFIPLNEFLDLYWVEYCSGFILLMIGMYLGEKAR